MRCSWLLIAWIAMPLHGNKAAGAEPFFTTIGLLPASDPDTFVDDVSPDGSVVVGKTFFGFGVNVPYYWTVEDGMVIIDMNFPFDGGAAVAASAAGRSIVIQSIHRRTGDPHSLLWNRMENTWTDLGDLPGGPYDTGATAISDDGSVVVGVSVSAESDPAVEAFRWTADTGIEPLGVLGGRSHFSVAADISADGSVIVGGSWGQEAIEAVRWTPEAGIESLGSRPEWARNAATAVSPDGQTIAGSLLDRAGFFHAWIWTEQDGYTILPNPWLGSSIVPTAVADGGRMVVGIVQHAGSLAFIWTPEDGMRDLAEVFENDYGFDLSDWVSFRAEDISADGRTIVGDGIRWIAPGTTANDGWYAFLGDPVGCTGDLDFDGQVTLGDLSRLLTNLGTPGGATFADGDLDGDGDVDPADLARMLSVFGSRCP